MMATSMSRIAMASAFAAVSCTASHDRVQGLDGSDAGPADARELDSAGGEDAIESEPEECIFNDNPVDMWIEGMTCDGIDELDEGEHVVWYDNGEIIEIADLYVSAHSYFHDDIFTIRYSGLTKEEIEHNLLLEDGIEVGAILYRHGGCVRGLVIHKPCGFNSNPVFEFRDGDLEGPMHPSRTYDEGTSAAGLWIHEQWDDCVVAWDPFPDCTVESTCSLSISARYSDPSSAVVRLGERVLFRGGPGDECRILNNACHDSSDCTSARGYLVQMWNPPWLCGM
jgi:hypothetical protein